MKPIFHTAALSLLLACGLFAQDIPTAEAVKSVNIEMAPNEMPWLYILSIFGAITGIVCGWITARRSNGIIYAFISAMLAAVLLPAIFCFVMAFFGSHQSEGFSIINGVLSGLFVMIYIGLGMAAFAAPASIVTAIASHAIFSRCYKT